MKISPPLLAGAAIGLIAGAAATAVVLSQGGGEGAPGGGRPGGGFGSYRPVVSMAAAENAAVQRRIDVIGQARAVKSVAITAEVAGLVDEVNIAPGKRVDEGDILLRIVDDEQQVALARARSNYPIAKENAERYRNLEADRAASALEAEQAQNEYITARAALDAAEVAVAQRRLIAPFDGIAGLTDIEVGDYVRAGDVVTTLDDTSTIIVAFAVPQESASFVNIGQKVTVALTGGRGVDYDGVITGVDSRVDPESRTLQVEAEVDNESGRLIPGAVLAVTTASEGEPAVAVPGLAVQWDRAGAYVWRRTAEGLAERASVVLLQRNDQQVLVEGDLQPGDVIVSEGADRVRAGLPLPDLEAKAGGPGVGAAGVALD